MRIEELQVGDWYQWYDYPYQMTKDMFASDDATINCFEPIRITAKILEHNAFVCYCCNGKFKFNLSIDPNTVITYSGHNHLHIIAYNNDCVFDKDNVRFVHELQHVLRVCGLNDIADNFVIK